MYMYGLKSAWCVFTFEQANAVMFVLNGLISWGKEGINWNEHLTLTHIRFFSPNHLTIDVILHVHDYVASTPVGFEHGLVQK